MCNDNLNLVELLGNCPKGTKLYSPIAGEVELTKVLDCSCTYPIECSSKSMADMLFSAEGKYSNAPDAECLLFPSKKQRDWSRFATYKEGDILTDTADGRAFILKGYTDDGYPIAYGGLNSYGKFRCGNAHDGTYGRWTSYPCRKATPEEINTLMRKINQAGYVWNQSSKTLAKDLPTNTLVIVSDDHSYDDLYLSRVVIRRYAGGGCCFNSSESSINASTRVKWEHIIPLNKFTVSDEGIVKFNKEDDYGTSNS